ncbi:type II secretion system F family protein [Paraburkholderia kururiensis]|uniref:type II secretion system F family protein n=1 Tax=Paraburkholderia kururiensis TaxID=984307 RepID=UPI0039A60E5F
MAALAEGSAGDAAEARVASAVALLIAAFALLCAAAALLLWRSGAQRSDRAAAARFVESRVASAAQGAALAGQGVHAAQAAPYSAHAAHANQAARPAPRSATAAQTLMSATPGRGAPLVAHVQYWKARVITAIDNTLRRAGIGNARMPLLCVSLGTLALAIWAFARGGVWGVLATLAFVSAGLGFVVSRRAYRRREKIVRQLPSFLDGIVRLIVLGNSVPAAFQAALQTTEAPLRECLDHVSRLLRSGVEIDRALYHVAGVYGTRELELVGAVLRLSVKYGGRADVMLDRMATFMRDLEQAGRELAAMSAETRLSACVLALLPLAIGGFLVLTNPKYFGTMWYDEAGRRLVFVAFGLQAFGAWMLYRLTRLRSGT